ncbi:MAG: hypothetical protein Alpg2KO_28580 [Alphaproteobacteria bacterium]
MSLTNRVKSFFEGRTVTGYLGGALNRFTKRPIGQFVTMMVAGALMLGAVAPNAMAGEFEDNMRANGLQTEYSQQLDQLDDRVKNGARYVVLDRDSIRLEESFAQIGGIQGRDRQQIIADEVFEETGTRLTAQELRVLDHKLFGEVGDDIRSIIASRDRVMRVENGAGEEVCIITPVSPDQTKEMAWEQLMNWSSSYFNGRTRDQLPDMDMYQKIANYQALSECADEKYAPEIDEPGYNFEERVYMAHSAAVFADVHAVLMLAQEGHGWQPADMMADMRALYTNAVGMAGARQLADQDVVERYAGAVYYSTPALRATRNYIRNMMEREGVDAPTQLSDRKIFQVAVQITDALSLTPEGFEAIHNLHRFSDRYRNEMRDRARFGGRDAKLYEAVIQYDGAVVDAIDRRYRDDWQNRRPVDHTRNVRTSGDSAAEIMDRVLDRADRQPGWEPYAKEMIDEIDRVRERFQNGERMEFGELHFLRDFGDLMNQNVLRIKDALREKSAAPATPSR